MEVVGTCLATAEAIPGPVGVTFTGTRPRPHGFADDGQPVNGRRATAGKISTIVFRGQGDEGSAVETRDH